MEMFYTVKSYSMINSSVYTRADVSDIDEQSKISDFKGYFIISNCGEKLLEFLTWTNQMGLSNYLLTEDVWDKSFKALLDKVYENPLYIKEIANEIKSLEDLAMFESVAEWSLYHQKKELEEFAENIVFEQDLKREIDDDVDTEWLKFINE